MSSTPVSPPTLRQLLRHRAAAADGLAARLLRILDETKAIPEDAKDRIRESVQSSLRQAAPYLVWRFALHTLDAERYLLTLVTVGSALPILLLVGYPFLRDPSPTRLAAAFAGLLLVAAFLVGLGVGLALMTVLMSVFRRFGGRVVAVAATAGLLFLAAGGLGSSFGRGWVVVTVQRGLWASGFFFVSFLVIAQSLHLAQVFALRFAIHRVPGAVVMELLLTLLAVEQRQGAAGTLPLGPTEVVNQLRQLADTVERALPRQFSGLNPVSERLLREEARSIAAAVDRLSMEMLLGGTEVLATLGSRLGAMLVQVAKGDWMSLARAAPGAARPSRLPDARTLVVAAVPLLLGLGLRWRVLPVDVAPDLVDGLVRFGVTWALLHALVALDPQVNEKIARTERLLKLLS